MSRRAWHVASAVALGATLGAAATVGWLSWRFQPRHEREDPDAVRAEISALSALHDSLTASVLGAMDADSLLAHHPEGDVLIALPIAFVDAIARDVVTGWFGNVDVHLRNLRVRKQGDVSARLSILGRRQVGSYKIDLLLRDVRGRLVPSPPTLAFRGSGISVALPVQLASGSGRGTIAFQWDSKGVANAVCGDLSVEREITGRVRPQRYTVRGRIALSAVNGTLVADPDFPELALRLFVEPSTESLALLRELLASKGKLCEVAVNRANVDDRVLALLDRGFNVKIPQRFFRPIELPVAVAAELPVNDQRLALTIEPSELRVTPHALWLGAGVRMTARPAPDGAPGGVAPPP